MSSNLKITFEDWLADKTFEEYHFNRELQDRRYQISVQRLILEKRYRDIIKKREFIDDATFEKIRNAQKTSFKKVRESLAEYHLGKIESQKANTKFLEIKLNNLQNKLKVIENNHPKIIENVYAGEDYSAFIWGGAHEFINSTTIEQYFRFMELVEDEIQSFGKPTPNIIEEETSFKELDYRLKCAKILDLNIKIHINREQTNLLSRLLNDTNKSSQQVSDRRDENMIDKTLMPEDELKNITTRKIYQKYHNLFDGGNGMSAKAAYREVEEWLLQDMELTIEDVKEKWNVTLELDSFTRSARNNRY